MSGLAAIIPARWASTRFPGKPLVPLAGKPMIQHVWERCQRCRHIDKVYIATDDERICQAATAFGAEAILTSRSHPSGTDRIAEVAAQLPKITHVMNVQGDEPTVNVRLLSRLAQNLKGPDSPRMITAATPFPEFANADDPNRVKVVIDRAGYALYFSRSPIPFDRVKRSRQRLLLHLGIYGFRRSFLLKFVSWRPSPLEKCENLEQLRALENGVRIKVVMTRHPASGVDMPEDVQKAEAALQSAT